MEIRPIQANDDYQAALRDIATLMDLDPDPGTPDGDRLGALAAQVQTYETKHFPISAPDPQ